VVFYTVKQVARTLRKSKGFVYGILASGELPGEKVGGEWRINRGGLMRYLKEGNRIKIIRNAYQSAYKKRYETTLVVVDTPSIEKVSSILIDVPDDQLPKYIDSYLALSSQYLDDRGYPLSLLSSQLPAIQKSMTIETKPSTVCKKCGGKGWNLVLLDPDEPNKGYMRKRCECQ